MLRILGRLFDDVFSIIYHLVGWLIFIVLLSLAYQYLTENFPSWVVTTACVIAGILAVLTYVGVLANEIENKKKQ